VRSWALGEDIQYLMSLREGTFFRDSHLRMLDFIIREIAVPGVFEMPKAVEG
jgi:hypothetical protein